MKNDVELSMYKRKDFWIWVLVGAALWISIALIYYVAGMKWLETTDASLFWRVVKNPVAFPRAIQPLYPYLVRGIIELFPGVDEAVLGQLLSFICYILAIPFIYQIFETLNINWAKELTLLWALFPLTGLTMSVYPRPNALLLLMTVLCFWGYVKNNKYVFLLSASLLPLIHKSSLFFLVFLIPLAVVERKIKLWMAFLTGIPTVIYIYFGSLVHDSPFWYFRSYYGTIHPITPLPFGDGLVGTIIQGFRGNTSDLIQGSMVIGYFLLIAYLLSQKLWRKNLIVLATTFPILVLGLVLPASEIMSMITYTSFAVISFALLDLGDGSTTNQKSIYWIFILLIVFCYLSQVAYAIYDLHYFGMI